MKKLLFLFLLVNFLLPKSIAQTFSDEFTYTGALTTNGWTAQTTGAGINAITVSTPGLSMTNLTSAGNAVTLTTSGEDIYKAIGSSLNSGTVYASFLVNVSSAQSTGDYFFHLIQDTTSGGTFIPRVFVKSTTGGIQFGISKNSKSTISYISNVYNLNITYLVSLKYTFNSTSTTDDVAELYVTNSVTNATEPTFLISAPVFQTDVSSSGFGLLALRQGTATSAANLKIDRIRIATNWTDVLGYSPPATITLNPTTLNAFTTTQNTPSATQSYTVSGANLSADIIIIAPTGFEISKTSATTGFSATQTLTQSSGSVSATTIYARLTGVSVGSPSGNITHVSGTASQNMAVTGTVSNQLVITVTPTSLSGFSTTEGTSSAEQTYTVSGTDLTGNITITPPSGVEISQTSGSGFSNSITLTQSGGSVASTTIYARLTGVSTGAVGGDIAHTSTGATTKNVAITGSVTTANPCQSQVTLVSTTDDYTSGVQLKEASSSNGKITATNLITGSAKVTYQSKVIELNAGFKVDSGAVFTAQIGGCN